MKIELPGTAGPEGWPAPGCRCASCARARAAGISLTPTRALLDGVPLETLPRLDVPGGWDVRVPSGHRVLVSGGPGLRPEPAPGVAYDAVLLDLFGAPDHLGRLRREGAVTDATDVRAVHIDHRVGAPGELDRRLAFWTRPLTGPFRTLLLGGSRSGKSAEAELRLMAHPDVTYVATGTGDPSDAEWTARIEAHRERRPSWWRTVETADLASALASATGAVLVDGIGSWVAAVMAETDAWDDPSRASGRVEELVAAWRGTGAYVVAVSDEVGMSLVPTTPVGRAFRDLLGSVNQRLAAEAETAALVVAGRVAELP
ncbi:bifunctional adenosylcobinamide kinase/adenosylcobinamide-phosphate guanylyltransferase [Actinomadura logoneensis]|uniref:Adenosylcobinamide kinase n=1 Tax=Actinomadura logoneensis TaxID=2293572 RepID=A0A372JH44_9ACTN|nr:bifunctional adenosylcobinamide kinase/adenosylcobinamide-phosphate guanylyltransferase [Actinomadura logoneensis]RFU39146.1 bifunctional adenosylcobinamide kinase/adenosylcobinamide-phosphate guanylyltransferase [Actinomadura logoneensis]